MRRDGRADALLDEHGEDGYVFPDYGGYCVAGVPGACLDALDARPADAPSLPGDVFDGVDSDGVENVLFVLVDGFGWDQWRRAADDERLETALLDRLAGRGTVTPLTSVFPSETAAAIPTGHTGQYPVEHGQLGWWQYLDDVGAAVQTLPYTTADGDPVREVYPDAPDPWDALYDADSLYARVPDDVTTRLFEPADISGRTSGRAFDAGADEYVGHENAPHLAVQVRRVLASADGRNYLYAYLPQVDASSHFHGPDAAETTAQLEGILGALRRALCDRLDPAAAERTLLVVSADHGHVDTGGENVDVREYDPVWSNLATGPRGDPIPPVGSSRQLQLHLRDGAVGRVRAALERDFDCRTFAREEYEARELFGPGDPGPAYGRHAPDLICVHRAKGMWYDDRSLRHVGKHGGATREEMLVPFAAARLSDLR